MAQIKQAFYGYVKNKRLVLNSMEAFKQDVARFENKKIKLELSELKDTRSEQQNAYYWGVVIPIFADYFGFSPAEYRECHEYIKYERLPLFIKTPRGETIRSSKSTASLKTNEFEDYMADLRKWGADEFELNIPEPNEIPYE